MEHPWCQALFASGMTDLDQLHEQTYQKIKTERKRNHWRQRRVVFQKTFWTSPRERGNFEGIEFFLCLVNEMTRKTFPTN